MLAEDTVKLDEILSCRGKTRILMLLAETNELNITEIMKNVGLNHSGINSHLKQLEEAGLVEQKRFGRIRIYKYRDEDPRAQALKALIQVWNNEVGRRSVKVNGGPDK